MQLSGGQSRGKTANMLAAAQARADLGEPVVIATRTALGVKYTPVQPSKEAVDDVLNGIEFLEGI